MAQVERGGGRETETDRERERERGCVFVREQTVMVGLTVSSEL